MNTTTQKILLIDDDVDLTSLLSTYLSNNGFTVDAVHSGPEALKQLDKNIQYDLMVLDIQMPGMTGLELLPQLRARIKTPVIMLTGRGEEVDRILGLEMGADDYLGKPCNPRELLARINAVLRRSVLVQQEASQDQISLHGLELDMGSRSIICNGTSVELTGTEFEVLAMLMQKAGGVVSKEDMTRKVLHRELTPYDRSIDVHVSRVRQQLRNYLGDKDLIKTIRGVGYQMVKDSE
ncbi:response regulator transcription factor [Porticoccaceae bacterium LTM1]|nr:response regulator transcription factor [Porticoccaceae bacterium LTM1]